VFSSNNNACLNNWCKVTPFFKTLWISSRIFSRLSRSTLIYYLFYLFYLFIYLFLKKWKEEKEKKEKKEKITPSLKPRDIFFILKYSIKILRDIEQRRDMEKSGKAIWCTFLRCFGTDKKWIASYIFFFKSNSNNKSIITRIKQYFDSPIQTFQITFFKYVRYIWKSKFSF